MNTNSALIEPARVLPCTASSIHHYHMAQGEFTKEAVEKYVCVQIVIFFLKVNIPSQKDSSIFFSVRLGYCQSWSEQNQISISQFDIRIQESGLPQIRTEMALCLNGRAARWKRISAATANNPRDPPLANLPRFCCDVLL